MRHLRFLSPSPKLFFIGFNKCGTTSLHRLFKSNGYLSVHARLRVWPTFRRRHLPLVWADNIAAGLPPLHGIGLYRVFSDTSFAQGGRMVEGNSFFRQLHQAHPDAYFVLNTRPVDRWINSRLKHRGGSLRASHAAIRGIPDSALAEVWRAEHDAFVSQATAYFAGNPRFRIFDIESDKVDDLAAFLAPDFDLDLRHWTHHNRT